MSKKYDCVDVTKLVMSLFVVAIHANLFNGALYPTIRLAVPVFFIFTGFFTFTKINTVPLNEKKYVLWSIEKRYIKLYLFWFVALLPLTVYVRKYYAYSFKDFIRIFLKSLVWGSTFPASWYLMACILGILIVHLLSRSKFVLQMFFCILAYLLATFTSKYQLAITENDMLNTWYLILRYFTGNPYNNVFVSILYIMIGKMIAEQRFISFNRKNSVICFAICYVGLLFEFYISKSQYWFQYNCDCWFMLAPTAIFFVLFIMDLNMEFKNTFAMRTISTIIYCSHMSIMMVVKRVLSILKIDDTQRVICFSITLLCTVVLYSVIIKLEKYNKFKFLKYSH